MDLNAQTKKIIQTQELSPDTLTQKIAVNTTSVLTTVQENMVAQSEPSTKLELMSSPDNVLTQKVLKVVRTIMGMT